VKFGLELHPDKTRLIEFGRPSEIENGVAKETRSLRILGVHASLWASLE
jgi:hypothetical protein